MGKLRMRDLTDAERSTIADFRAPAWPGAPEAVLPTPGARKLSLEVPSFGQLLASSGLRDGDLPERDATPLRDLDL